MLRRLFPDVRDDEKQRFGFFLTLAAVLLTGQAVAMTVCESLLLSRLGVSALPVGVLLASAMTFLASTVYGNRLGKLRNEDLFLWILGVSMAVVALSIPLVKAGVGWSFHLLFAFHCVTFTIFTTHFDSLAGEYFDTLSAKRILPLLGVGATLGEICGGLSASGLTKVIKTESLLYVWFGLLLAAALYIALSRSRLKQWNPSLKGQVQSKTGPSAAASLKRYPLARSLGIAVVAAVGAMSVVQYVASDVFVAAFPSEAKLAAFLGTMLALTNIVELFVGAKLTPWLIRRLGVARTNTIHPIGAVLTLGLLQLHYGLIPAILAWVNRKTVHDALARPARALLFNAFPQNVRAGLRGFLQGVVASVARAVAGISLVLFQSRLDGPNFVIAGLALALLYLVAASSVGRRYLLTLVDGLAEGRLKLHSSPEIVGSVAELDKRWQQLLKSPQEEGLSRLIAALVETKAWPLLKQGLHHSQDWVRTASVIALGPNTPPETLCDPSPEVRLAAVRALWRSPELLGALTDDPDERIRELALAATGRLQEPEIEAHLVEYLHDRYLPQVIDLLGTDSTPLRCAALRRLTRLPEVPLSKVSDELRHPQESVVQAAMTLLEHSQDPLATVILATSLEDERAAIRAACSAHLGRRGATVLPHLESYLRATRESTVESTYDAIALTNSEPGRELLGQELRLLVRRGWRSLFLARAAEIAVPEAKMLRLSLHDDAERNQRLAYRVLSSLEGERMVGPVVNSLRFSNSSARASALEVLSNLGDREAANLLVMLTERHTPLAERLELVARSAPGLARVPVEREELLAECAQFPSRFVRLATLAQQDLIGWSFGDRYLELKQCELFSKMSLEQLEHIQGELVCERFAGQETVISQNQPCDRIYLLQEGEVDQPGAIFGELPALDGGTALRSVRATTNCRLWSLDSRRLRGLVKRYPNLAFPLFQRLSRQLKRTS